VSVRYTRDALVDLDRISAYLAERNRPAANAVLRAIETVVDRLARFPHSAPETEIAGVRAAPALRYPYIIFYRARGNDIEVLYVRHAARLRPWETKNDAKEE
jgi:plasmid stabilization system protein ParE